MSPSARTPRRLPARVYWVRRGMVVLSALLLVFAVGRLLGGSGGSGGDTAGTVADRHTPTSTPTFTPTLKSTPKPTTVAPVGRTAPTTPAAGVPLAQPSGPCNVADVTVTPTVTSARAGGVVVITLQLTGTAPACTFAVGPSSIAVKITHSVNGVWSSQQCPSSIPHGTVVVRNAVPTSFAVRWSGRESDENCSRSTAWALPGTYKVTAAAIGSEPADTGFVLLSPDRPTVFQTITATPTPTPKATPTAKATSKAKPTATPTGKVD
jgi:hypothetical protein